MPFQQRGRWRTWCDTTARAAGRRDGLGQDRPGAGTPWRPAAGLSAAAGGAACTLDDATGWRKPLRFLRSADGRRSPRVHVVHGPETLRAALARMMYILHYLLLRGLEAGRCPGWALPAADLSTRCRSCATAARRSTARPAWRRRKAARVIGLSGTPIYNRGGEIWNVINILDFHALGDWESFTREWC